MAWRTRKPFLIPSELSLGKLTRLILWPPQGKARNKCVFRLGLQSTTQKRFSQGKAVQKEEESSGAGSTSLPVATRWRACHLPEVGDRDRGSHARGALSNPRSLTCLLCSHMRKYSRLNVPCVAQSFSPAHKRTGLGPESKSVFKVPSSLKKKKKI